MKSVQKTTKKPEERMIRKRSTTYWSSYMVDDSLSKVFSPSDRQVRLKRMKKSPGLCVSPCLRFSMFCIRLCIACNVCAGFGRCTTTHEMLCMLWNLSSSTLSTCALFGPFVLFIQFYRFVDIKPALLLTTEKTPTFCKELSQHQHHHCIRTELQAHTTHRLDKMIHKKNTASSVAR